MVPVLFSVIFLAGNAFASQIANQYFDRVLYVLSNVIQDPAPLPDFGIEFEDEVENIGQVKGKAEFENGQLTGLSEGRRFTECQGPYYSFGARNVDCTINLANLQIEYDGELMYGEMPTVNIRGLANVTNTFLFITVTGNPPLTPRVEKLLFQQIGQMNTKFLALGPLNSTRRVLQEGFRYYVRGEVFISMSQWYPYAFNRSVAMTPFPN